MANISTERHSLTVMIENQRIYLLTARTLRSNRGLGMQLLKLTHLPGKGLIAILAF